MSWGRGLVYWQRSGSQPLQFQYEHLNLPFPFQQKLLRNLSLCHNHFSAHEPYYEAKFGTMLLDGVSIARLTDCEVLYGSQNTCMCSFPRLPSTIFILVNRRQIPIQIMKTPIVCRVKVSARQRPSSKRAMTSLQH